MSITCSQTDCRILVLTPTGKDAQLAVRAIGDAHLSCLIVQNLAALVRELRAPAGGVLIAEEALEAEGAQLLAGWVAQQPSWSDLPIVVLACAGPPSPVIRDAIASLRNVTVVTRPTTFAALVSNLRAAVRARRRQYEVRDQMEAIARSERDLNDFFENAAVGLHLVNGDGIIVRANRTELELLGYTASEYIGQPVARFHVDAPVIQDILDRLKAGEILANYEARLRAKDGSIKHVLISSNARFDNGRFIHSRCFTRDITIRRQAEDALREANRHKDEFLAMLAHELRNPLAPLRNAVDVWRMSDPADRAISQMRDIIDRQVTHLSRLVDDLLDVSRISQGKIVLRRETIDLCQIVARLVDDRRNQLHDSRIDLHLELPVRPLWVHGDATRLSQAITNLLQNAEKFTDAGGTITVSLRSDSAGANAILEVRDTGIGMEPETIGGLFRAFAQADRSLDRTRGGLGLGLALVRGLMDLHGGRVEAHSDGPGLGSQFTISLPLVAAPPSAAPAPDAAAPRRSRRVLVIDDRRDATLTLTALLAALGHRVQSASTADEGLIVARQWRPEVIISDIGLPGNDGYTFARWARADPELCRTTLVALTGYGRSEDQVRAREAGFDFHLTKPAALRDLERVLNQV
jgi:PAS domain S-box-containing protein